jgi:protein-L-isoaspartate O-methyltransferase
MNCYLCQSTSFRPRNGQVRDAPELEILECINCGLVALSSHSHIESGFYEDSGMHGVLPTPIDVWLRETNWDDQRRLDSLAPILANKKVLDFGCGSGGFLMKAKALAARVEGVELERRVREYWQDQIMIYPNVESVGTNRYDVITGFHVIEHLTDPRTMLKTLATKLAKNGRIVIEVPSSEDALYICSALKHCGGCPSKQVCALCLYSSISGTPCLTICIGSATVSREAMQNGLSLIVQS